MFRNNKQQSEASPPEDCHLNVKNGQKLTILFKIANLAFFLEKKKIIFKN